MKPNQIILTYAGTPLAELPTEIREQLEAHPDWLEALEAQAEIASLVNLKNYEQPDPAQEGRVAHRVGIRIQNGEHLRRESKLDALPDWARMVAVVLFMLALSVLTHREMLDNPDVDSVADLALGEAELRIDQAKNPLTPLYTSEDPFAPMFMSVDTQQFPNLLTPEFSQELEISFMELGLDFSNRNNDPNLLPVSFAPLR